MDDRRQLDDMMAKYLAQAHTSTRENRMIFNHVCIRVEDLDAAERLLSESFGIDGFVSPGGGTFDDEDEFRVAWLDDNNMYIEITKFEKPQEIGYDTGVGQAIGHLSEIGFFVPDMDRALEHLGEFGWKVTSRIHQPGARMYKIDTDPPSGIPVELVDIDVDELESEE
jgi:hypothetical protein